MKCALYSIRHHSRLSLFLSAVMLSCCLFSSPPLQAEENETAKQEPFRFDLVPGEALGVIAVRPAQLLAASMNKPIRELTLKEQKRNADFGVLGINPTDLASITIIYLPRQPGETGKLPIKFAVVVKSAQKLDRNQIQNKLSKTELKETGHKGMSFLTNGAPDGDALLFLDEHEFVLSDNASAVKQIIEQINDRKSSVWKGRLQSVASASVAGGVNMKSARSLVGGPLIQQVAQRLPIWPLLSPLWEHSEIAALGITVDQSLSMELIFEQEQHSQEIKQSLTGLLDMGKNMLQQIKASSRQKNLPLPMQHEVLVLEAALKSAAVTQSGSQVQFSTSLSSAQCNQLVSTILPAVLQARAAARRSVSKNNIKHIMLALYNYHDRYHHFPPAVVMGPDGKTPHSWRVELLPYLDQQALYNEYRMNEPWDSAHNLKIAKTVVPVFQNPNSEKPANASYFAVVGEGTAFGNQKGVSFKDITDGTSNTIAIVEAKRDIPWTKPEDISYDGKKLPAFGGYFENPATGGAPATNIYFVGLCDGSVRMLTDHTEESFLKALLTIADGKPDQSQ
ncbi:hypothetical protein Pan153_38760 [Gimesia panareensis]|uniref:DUF1559 domain-containing protein n=1 Tax=Gimesia panareensis TaxID=2527978 RepID=A0A518FS89_9PLAN|nr:DUF1559 domain-containing protein [Gimesia panareensis]QDV19211.1 hypothetical protein Pan153_38760 [Gimesia panareensis]